MAPSNFQAVNITSTSITFSWDALVDGANGIIQSYIITYTTDDNSVIMVSLVIQITECMVATYVTPARSQWVEYLSMILVVLITCMWVPVRILPMTSSTLT